MNGEVPNMRNHESLQRLARCLCASVALTLSLVSAARAEVKVTEYQDRIEAATTILIVGYIWVWKKGALEWV